MEDGADRYGEVVTVLGSHVLYLVEWLLGPARALRASTENRLTASWAPPGRRAAAERAHIDLELESGIPVEVSLCNTSGGDFMHRWEVRCAGGTVRLENSSRDYVSGFVLSETASRGAMKVLARELRARR